MTLAATELGLGSLWICNTFFAQEELNHWLNADGQLYAALAVGYADEAPAPRPRRKAELTVEWRKEHNLHYPNATSRTIINANPMANPMVPILECSPSDASGTSSSTTT